MSPIIRRCQNNYYHHSLIINQQHSSSYENMDLNVLHHNRLTQLLKMCLANLFEIRGVMTYCNQITSYTILYDEEVKHYFITFMVEIQISFTFILSYAIINDSPDDNFLSTLFILITHGCCAFCMTTLLGLRLGKEGNC